MKAERVISADIGFGTKASDKFDFFVPGEEVRGTCYIKLNKATLFKQIHLELVGEVSLKHGWKAPSDKDKKKKEKEKGEEEGIVEQMVVRCGYSYDAPYGANNSRTFSFPFSFLLPSEAPPSFEWSPLSSDFPNVSGGHCRYSVFVWLDVSGVGRAGPALPAPELCSGRAAVIVAPQFVSEAVGGPKPASGAGDGIKRRTQSESVYESRAGKISLGVSVEPVVLVPGGVEIAATIDNGNTKIPIDTVMFVVEEISQVSFGTAEQKKNKKGGGNFVRIVKMEKPQQPVFVASGSRGVKVRQRVEFSLPRGAEPGCVGMPSMLTKWLGIEYRLRVFAKGKGMKDDDLSVTIPLYLAPLPQERQTKEYKV